MKELMAKHGDDYALSVSATTRGPRPGEEHGLSLIHILYIMKGQMDTQYGQILIDTDVIATYAGSVAVECFGIVGMAAVNMKGCLLYTSRQATLRYLRA